ncbi:hypothetical protein EAY31_06845 [Vibrio anguillarum]|nr:hypothetical protein [Vibrio anguillarum]MBF4298220.1 hypothetical protein [Vibrio anguillarum]MBF4361545.1 hypothetical protein [Vibrio anguillarum]MBF4397535.1 hypothetical protein [Vibrio anguillarum]MBF4438520.1 hypothetical protein [Vibrio anguillarum]
MQILLMKSWRSFCLLPENKCSNKSLQDFLVLLRWQRFMFNVITNESVRKMIDKAVCDTKTD